MRVEIYSFKSFSSIIIPTFMFHRGTVKEREGEEAEKTGGGEGKEIEDGGRRKRRRRGTFLSTPLSPDYK